MFVDRGGSPELGYEVQAKALRAQDLYGALDRSESGFYFEETQEGGRYILAGFTVEKTLDITSKKNLEDVETELREVPEALRHLPFVGGAIGVVDFEYCYPLFGLQGRGSSSYGFFHIISDFILIDKKRDQTNYISLRKGSLGVQRIKQRIEEGKKTRTKNQCSEGNSFTSFNQSRFVSNVGKIKDEIVKGNIFQCVIAEQKEAHFTGASTELLDNFRKQNRVPYLFLLKSGERHLIGASPERLVQVKANGQINSVPIAGTRPRGSDSATDEKHQRELQACEKERAEHLMLVDLARNDLGRVSRPGSVKVDKFMEIKKFDQVMHLVSEVNGLLKPECHPLDVFNASFPAGTLSGAPKKEAIKNIHRLEVGPRRSYGGAVVLYDNNRNLESFIAIRCLERIGNRILSGAGAGIVHYSNPESEFLEIQHKIKTAELALAPAVSKKLIQGG